MASISAREFNQDVSAAKRAADRAPVVITDRGRPSHVLLSIETYERLVGGGSDIVDLLSADDDVDLEPGRATIDLRVPDL